MTDRTGAGLALLLLAIVPLIGMVILKLLAARARAKQRFLSTQARKRLPLSIRLDKWIGQQFRRLDGFVSLSRRQQQRRRRASRRSGRRDV
jgi:hypothetical protein